MSGLVDSFGNEWTLVQTTGSGKLVARNGVVDSTTSHIANLLYYNSIISYQNTSGVWASWSGTQWVALFGDPRALTPSIGPIITAGITVDFTSLTTHIADRELFGVSTAAMSDFNFVLCNNPTFQGASKAFDPPLLRLSCNSGSTSGPVLSNAFPNGPSGGMDANVYAPIINNLNKIVNLQTCKIIMGFGGSDDLGPTLGWTVHEFAGAFSQVVQRFRTATGSDGKVVDPIYWEIMNETDGTLHKETYLAYFNACAAAAHAIDLKYVISGPASLLYFDSVDALILNSGPDNLGLPGNHAFLYSPGVDVAPSDLQLGQAAMMSGGNTPESIASSINSTIAATYAANLPWFYGEYNIGSPLDGREQSVLGACYTTSTLFKLASNANARIWAGFWEYSNSAGYGLMTGSSFTPTPSGVILSKLGQVAAGTLVNISNSTSLLTWATVNGFRFCLVVVNPTTDDTGQTVCLGNWPINTDGTGIVNRFEVSRTSPNGLTTTESVAGSLTQFLMFPGQSVTLLYV